MSMQLIKGALFCCQQRSMRDRPGATFNPCQKLLSALEINPDDEKIIFCLHTSAYPSAQPLKIRHITDKCHNNSFPALPFIALSHLMKCLWLAEDYFYSSNEAELKYFMGICNKSSESPEWPLVLAA